MRRAALAVLLACAPALGCAAARSEEAPDESAAEAQVTPQSAAQLTAPGEGERLALSLPDLKGRQHSLAKLRGKVVLLDFWATWCEPCKRGLPITEKLARENASRGLVVFAVSADEDPTAVPPFMVKYNVGLPVLLDPSGVAAEKLGGEQIPFAVLIDRQGRVRGRETGSDEAAEGRVAAGVARLLAEPAQ